MDSLGDIIRNANEVLGFNLSTLKELGKMKQETLEKKLLNLPPGILNIRSVASIYMAWLAEQIANATSWDDPSPVWKICGYLQNKYCSGVLALQVWNEMLLEARMEHNMEDPWTTRIHLRGPLVEKIIIQLLVPDFSQRYPVFNKGKAIKGNANKVPLGRSRFKVPPQDPFRSTVKMEETTGPKVNAEERPQQPGYLCLTCSCVHHHSYICPNSNTKASQELPIKEEQPENILGAGNASAGQRSALTRQVSPETPYHTFRYDNSEDSEKEDAHAGQPSALEGRASLDSQGRDILPTTTAYDTFRDGVYPYDYSRPVESNSGGSLESPYHTFREGVYPYSGSRPEPSTAPNSGDFAELPNQTVREETGNNRTIILKESGATEGRLTPWSEDDSVKDQKANATQDQTANATQDQTVNAAQDQTINATQDQTVNATGRKETEAEKKNRIAYEEADAFLAELGMELMLASNAKQPEAGPSRVPGAKPPRKKQKKQPRVSELAAEPKASLQSQQIPKPLVRDPPYHPAVVALFQNRENVYVNQVKRTTAADMWDKSTESKDGQEKKDGN
ncbi:unnamed protein product [Clonostachys byssicola]|uniref:Uncharacterized protein n=1 Tax=Clonostachys byssicola TaxID=160290 RepID=A0A9N9Y9Y6_9HYPO|nr:unnamed protein product [Clonostachys byssicola]